MRGFPIVSIGSLTGAARSECEIYYPLFEQDEYYDGDNTLVKQLYLERFPLANNAGYIKSVNAKENNLDANSGVQTKIAYSLGFHHNANGYGSYDKVQNIKNLRMDSFYANMIDSEFMCYGTFFTDLEIENWYFNLPNLKSIGYHMSLSISSFINTIYFNFPKLESIGNGLFNYDKTINNIKINATNDFLVGSSAFANWNDRIVNFYGTNEELLNSLIEQLNTNIDQSIYNNNITLENKGLCNLSEFDIRYWDLWQNTTGKDSGLH